MAAGRIFGIALEESIKYARVPISYMDGSEQFYGSIPIIVAKCGAYLKDQGVFVEGVFRVSGSVKRMARLQELFDTPPTYGLDLEWAGYTVHDAANLLRRYCNHLPDPIITHAYYGAFREVLENEGVSESGRVAAFQALIHGLPAAHQFLLLYLLDLLAFFAAHASRTRMDRANLASVFQPGILSHPSDQLSPSEYKASQRVVEFLIEHQACFTAKCGLKAIGVDELRMLAKSSSSSVPSALHDKKRRRKTAELSGIQRAPLKRLPYKSRSMQTLPSCGNDIRCAESWQQSIFDPSLDSAALRVRRRVASVPYMFSLKSQTFTTPDPEEGRDIVRSFLQVQTWQDPCAIEPALSTVDQPQPPIDLSFSSAKVLEDSLRGLSPTSVRSHSILRSQTDRANPFSDFLRNRISSMANSPRAKWAKFLGNHGEEGETGLPKRRTGRFGALVRRWPMYLLANMFFLGVLFHEVLAPFPLDLSFVLRP
ncbi:uncharacterized protein VTP21DRAFT_9297 [Calcarisporiella thermophila]|uniref:uncharacterized protein n=1 Tax=Calcarisporiella thermophila TaxID=911321 RepID=UPI0037428CFA